MEECLSWVRKKKLPKGDFPYIKAFLFPEYGIPECVLRDVQIKRKLIDCLIKHHDCKTRNLLRLGFNKNDIPKIQEEEKSTGMTGLVKGLFGFGRQTKKEDNEIPKGCPDTKQQQRTPQAQRSQRKTMMLINKKWGMHLTAPNTTGSPMGGGKNHNIWYIGAEVHTPLNKINHELTRMYKNFMKYSITNQ